MPPVSTKCKAKKRPTGLRTALFGLLMLTRQLAVELAPQIRVNGISPGTVAFPEDYTEEQRASLLRRVPAGREGTPEDVARAVIFLVRDAPYVTGHVIALDGGRSAQL